MDNMDKKKDMKQHIKIKTTDGYLLQTIN
jgi:hypothetical protein